MTALLETEGLAVGHGRRVVARDIRLRLEAGRVLCLLGPNGGGKTTLLRTLLGLIAPLGGTIRLGGADLRSLSRREVARQLAYVPQAGSGGFAYAAREVVAMGRAALLPLLASPGRGDLAAAEAALGRLGIGHLADAPVTELSGGERQLVLIARALVQGAAALVMDEPTASLDFGNQAMVLGQIRDLARQDGLGVLMTTHQPDHALLVGDAVALLHGGRMEGPDAPEAMVTAQRLQATYGVAVALGRIQGRMVCAPVLPGSVPGV